MKRIVTLLAVLLIVGRSPGQLSAPSVESVYGGRILGIAAVPFAADSTLVYITTESANTAFATTVIPGTSTVRTFTVLPALGNDDNYGSAVRYIAADSASQCLYFITGTGLYSTKYNSSSVTTVATGTFSAVTVSQGRLYFMSGTQLRFGSLNSSGVFTEGAGSPLTVGTVTNPSIVIHPLTQKVYIGSAGTSPVIYRSSDDASSLSGATTFATVGLTGLTSGITWTAIGIGPDGRLFYGGNLSTNKTVDYSDDETNWTSSGIAINGVGGYNFAFATTSATDYHVYFGTAHSTLRGESGTWELFGATSLQTHPNDGAVIVDPKNNSVVYLTTDQGIGISTNRGSIISEIDDGVEATQVQDFDMTVSKTYAWLASKSGIRKVSSFLTAPSWSAAMFPNGDGAPYYSAEMVKNNPLSAYVGNQRVYKTMDGGATWSQKFTAENAPYNFPHVDAWIEAIEVCPFDTNTIFAGYYDQTSAEGGLFYSTDGGSAWSQIHIQSVSDGPDVDVRDIVFNIEGSDTVAYVGVSYDLSSPAGKSTYRLVRSGTAWTVSQDMSSAHTSTATNWVVSINDLCVSSTGDTVLAAGTDAGTNHPVAYYKVISGANLWTPFPTSGFPFSAGKQGKAITLGGDTIYCAVDHEVYMIHSGGTAWTVGHTYPVGTMINVLYYDDLLVGTGTGLYSHTVSGTLPVEVTMFSVSASATGAHLHWKTATEVKNLGFSVDRWSGSVWKKIGSIHGHGTTNAPQSYDYVDKDVPQIRTRYRLMQTDLDGSTRIVGEVEYTPVSVVRSLELRQNYPDPFNPSTMIEFAVPVTGHARIRVFNAIGQEVATIFDGIAAAGSFITVPFDGTRYSSGVYFYSAESGNKVQVRKMVLMK